MFWGQVFAGLPGYGYKAWLGRMLVMAMAAFVAHLSPTIIFDPANRIRYFGHGVNDSR